MSTKKYAFGRNDDTYIIVGTDEKDQVDLLALDCRKSTPEIAATREAYETISAQGVMDLLYKSVALRKTEESKINHIHELMTSLVVTYDDAFRSAIKPYHGCTVLYGPAGSGKTTLVGTIAAECKQAMVPFSYIHASEPHFDAVSMSSGLLTTLGSLLTASESVITLDSLRGILYSGAGSTLSGGISSLVIDTLSVLSKTAEATNNMLFLVINPLTRDDDKNAFLREAVKGSTTNLAILDDDNFATLILSMRKADRKERIIQRNALVATLMRGVPVDTSLDRSIDSSSSKKVDLVSDVRTTAEGNFNVDLPILNLGKFAPAQRGMDTGNVSAQVTNPGAMKDNITNSGSVGSDKLVQKARSVQLNKQPDTDSNGVL